MSRFEPFDAVRYDGIPPFEGIVLELIPDHEMPVNDLVDDTMRTGPAYAVLTDKINSNGEPLMTFVWEDDRCLVSAT